jgi:hypothetical protein
MTVDVQAARGERAGQKRDEQHTHAGILRRTSPPGRRGWVATAAIANREAGHASAIVEGSALPPTGVDHP